MKIQFQNHPSFVSMVALAAFCSFSPAVRADWGSVRANNHTPPHPYHQVEHRHVGVEQERYHAFYWSRFSAGMTVTALPQGYVQVSTGAVGFYYFDGVYYQPTTDGTYIVVAPPLGVIVPQLPSGAETMTAGPATYYYAGGAFYFQQPTGFVVVQPPLGVTITALPTGAAPVVISGVLYYLAAGAYYQPIMQGGVTVYVTARP